MTELKHTSIFSKTNGEGKNAKLRNACVAPYRPKGTSLLAAGFGEYFVQAAASRCSWLTFRSRSTVASVHRYNRQMADVNMADDGLLVVTLPLWDPLQYSR